MRSNEKPLDVLKSFGKTENKFYVRFFMFVYVKCVEGVSKNTNKEYQIVTLVEFRRVKGVVKAKFTEFFPASKLDLRDFKFGDVVEPQFIEPEFFGDFPRLTDLSLTLQSPYNDMID